VKRVCIFLLTLSFSAKAIVPEKVVILGVCRDVEKRLPKTMQIMEQIGSLFADYKIIVYENNSEDGTPDLLRHWASRNSKVHVLSEKLSHDELQSIVVNTKINGEFFRPELISRARNIVMDVAMSDAYNDFPYIIWMDMDFIIPPDFAGIVETFESKRDWDGVLAYGVDPDNKHWDWYAFRDATLPIGSELLGNKWWYLPKTFSLNPNDDWYPVYSAFGGCGIYKKSSIGTCRYSAVVTKDLEDSARNIIREGMVNDHPQILDYKALNERMAAQAIIDRPNSGLLRIEDPEIGITLDASKDAVVFRMSSFVYQYPSTCEHVSFHACMSQRGHAKLFINPRLVFHYGDKKYGDAQ